MFGRIRAVCAVMRPARVGRCFSTATPATATATPGAAAASIEKKEYFRGGDQTSLREAFASGKYRRYLTALDLYERRYPYSVWSTATPAGLLRRAAAYNLGFTILRNNRSPAATAPAAGSGATAKRAAIPAPGRHIEAVLTLWDRLQPPHTVDTGLVLVSNISQRVVLLTLARAGLPHFVNAANQMLASANVKSPASAPAASMLSAAENSALTDFMEWTRREWTSDRLKALHRTTRTTATPTTTASAQPNAPSPAPETATN